MIPAIPTIEKVRTVAYSRHMFCHWPNLNLFYCPHFCGFTTYCDDCGNRPTLFYEQPKQSFLLKPLAMPSITRLKNAFPISDSSLDKRNNTDKISKIRVTPKKDKEKHISLLPATPTSTQADTNHVFPFNKSRTFLIFSHANFNLPNHCLNKSSLLHFSYEVIII